MNDNSTGFMLMVEIHNEHVKAESWLNYARQWPLIMNIHKLMM